ncbi:hypothetical protein CEXT_482181 [Caerostris extrusa]|uniref:Ycf15 n=1 Tax=Caerostris extrusa TaxID=172846 RepID=A0AAV4W5I0_CAEEX|nr:hypothetical protein CEXT_482181 [Caerostris extrusa]
MPNTIIFGTSPRIIHSFLVDVHLGSGFLMDPLCSDDIRRGSQGNINQAMTLFSSRCSTPADGSTSREKRVQPEMMRSHLVRDGVFGR